MGKIMSKENIKKNIPYLQNVKEVGFHYEGESYPPTYIYIFKYNDNKIEKIHYHSKSHMKSDIEYLKNNGVKIISTYKNK